MRHPSHKDLEMAYSNKIALGSGCHWCTEAVFLALIGVENVEQGYVALTDENTSFSEAVVIHFNLETISLQTLIEIHLCTHKSTSQHAIRKKYRSAIYYVSETQKTQADSILNTLQNKFKNKLVTKAYPFSEFKPSREAIQNYYQKNSSKAFCERFITPKLNMLLKHFSEYIDSTFMPRQTTQSEEQLSNE